MLIYMLLFGFLYVIGRIFYIKKKNLKINIKREICLGILIVYLIGFISQTILPRVIIYKDYNTEKIIINFITHRDISEINIIPFKTIISYLFLKNSQVSNWRSVGFQNILSSIIIYFPFGILLPAINKAFRKLNNTLLSIAIIAFIIEFIKHFVGRSSDIDDVILGVFGAFLGHALFTYINKRKKSYI